MACNIQRDKLTDDIVRVVANNGNPSLLYKNILDTFRPTLMGEYANSTFIGVDGSVYSSNPRTSYFNELSKLIYKALPPVKEGYTRFWRGARKADIHSNPIVTNSLIGIALPFAYVYDRILLYVDIPIDESRKYLQTGVVAKDSEFDLNQGDGSGTKYISQMKIVDPEIYREFEEAHPKGVLSFYFTPALQEAAARIYANIYTPSFKLKFGDWETLERVKRTDPGNGYLIDQLETSVSHNIDNNGEPTLESLTDYLPNEVRVNMGDNLKSKIDTFLANIGVSVKTANLPKDINAQADLLNKTIKLAIGQEEDLSILGEEAAHFYISMLPKDSSLYKDMFNRITSLPIYKQVLNQYLNVPEYQVNGKPNFSKLKEEAMGKYISSLMNDEEGNRSWLDRLITFIKNIFRVSNPFLSVRDNILSSKIEGLDSINIQQEDTIMYNMGSNTDTKSAFDNLKSMSERISQQETNKTDPETGNKIISYFIDGKEIGKRVTNLVKDFYKKKFPSWVSSTNPNREVYNIQAEKGTAIHNDIQDIIQRMVNDEGHLKDSISEHVNRPQSSDSIYSMLEEHLKDRLSSIVNRYGTNTRFMTEVKIYDPSKDVAGTIDLLVIKPNGRVDIYDWKSSDFNGGNIKNGIPWYKQEGYSIQLDEYSRILKTSYNVDTDLKRAIPIRAKFTKNATTNKYTNLSGIEIGNANVSLITDENRYLLPVPSLSEKTGIEQVDKLLTRLKSLYAEISDRKVSIDEKFIKDQELNKIKEAIQDLHIKQSLNGLVTNGQLLLDTINKAIKDNSLTIAQAQTYYKELLVYADISKVMSAMEKSSYGETLTNEAKAIIYELSGAANEAESSLKEYLLNGANEIANSVGIKDVTQAEKEIGFWNGTIRSISNTPNATVATFYKYLSTNQNRVLEDSTKINDKLKNLRSDLTQWAKTKGIDTQRIFDGILETDDKGRWNGSFLNKYSKEFRDLKKKYIEERDINGLLDILDLEEGKESFNKRLENFNKWLSDTNFSLDETVNKKIKDKKAEEWNYRYNVYDPKYRDTALLYYQNNIPGKDKYLSNKWKELQKDENKPLKEVYDYFQSLLKYADNNLGMIDNTGKFIPNIENDKIDLIAQHGFSSVFNMKGFFESMEYKTNNTFGEIDPITGKPKRTVPKLFLNNLGTTKIDEISNEEYTDYSMKSKDLFTVFSIWGRHMAEYEYMSNLEEIGSLMLTVEDIKNKHLQRDKSGKYVEVTGNQKNYQYLDDFVNYFVYGQKLQEPNAWEFDLFGKQYSGKSLVQGLIRYMGMKTLAFNTLSISANYVGGKFNTFFVATKNKFFDRKQWAHGEYAFHTDKGKALVKFFDAFLEDESYKRANQLSVFDSVKFFTYDKLFIGQRKTDELVQFPVLLAMTKSYGIIDNKITNLREHVQNKLGYSNIFNLPIEEQRKLQSEIDNQVKQLEDSVSIWELSKIEGTGKQAKLTIPGISRADDTVLDFRKQVKRANKSILGNATGEDISRYRMTLIGHALGQFRNWMPSLLDERFSELRYNVDTDNWTRGRAKSFFNNYFSSTNDNLSKNKQVLDILTKHIGTLAKDLIGFTSIADRQTRAKQLYLREKTRAIEQGLDFKISEHEFIQLHMDNMRAMINELRTIITFVAIPFAIASSLPPEDKNSGIAKYVTRTLDKYNNELLFYYVPSNFTQLIKSPVPFVGLLEDIGSFTTALVGQGYAVYKDDEELMKKYKPTKYILKDVPIAKEVYTLGTIFDEDMRKMYGVTN